VINRQQVFVAHTIEQLAEVFFDHQLIAQLGLGSVINWPIVFNGNVVGTVNLLAGSGAYEQQSLEILEQLYPWLLVPFVGPFEIKESS